jgi:RimJ/RimL family protein N-acetyltransferase
MGFGFWAVEERTSSDFIGEVGFAEFRRDIEPSIRGIPELGWVLASGVHGRGYATEAVRAALDWGAANLPANRTVCLIHPDNLKSIRVADKCGFKEYCRTSYKNAPVRMFKRDNEPK